MIADVITSHLMVYQAFSVARLAIGKSGIDDEECEWLFLSLCEIEEEFVRKFVLKRESVE